MNLLGVFPIQTQLLLTVDVAVQLSRDPLLKQIVLIHIDALIAFDTTHSHEEDLKIAGQSSARERLRLNRGRIAVALVVHKGQKVPHCEYLGVDRIDGSMRLPYQP